MSLGIRMAFAVAATLGCALVASGCKQSEKQAPAQTTPATAAAPASPGAPTPAPASGPSAPITEEDFEAEAARSIDANNLDQSLNELENEIRAK